MSRFKGVVINPLPDTLWELLEVALNDLAKAEKKKGMQVRMTSWVVPQMPNTCQVCLAGALLVFSGGLDWKGHFDKFELEDVPLGVQHKLLALDMMRRGRVTAAANVMNRSNELEKIWQGPIDDFIPEYADNRAGFKRALRKLVKELKAAGV